MRVERVGADELAFRWFGGRVSLDFTATVGERWRGRFERLRAPDDLARWFVEAGIHPDAVPVSYARMRQARYLREALYRLFRSTLDATSPDPTDIGEVNRWATRSAPGAALGFDRGTFTVHQPALDAAMLLAAIARDGVDLLTGPSAGRIKECGRDDCALLFLDESRAGVRRWCSMSACGARSKMSAYRSRQSFA
ncbi:ABATE domain-containing protein [Actinoplanes sp. NPDC051633]|uniref:CGNR zinc finger domain-containing protein n=1 Tax=Actinoplanes sp. NPDC051633 TaxID=3155670 RepID=UPI003447AA13